MTRSGADAEGKAGAGRAHLCRLDRPQTSLLVKGGVLLADLKALLELRPDMAGLPGYPLVQVGALDRACCCTS